MTATHAAIRSHPITTVAPSELVDRLRAVLWPGLAVQTARTPDVLADLARRFRTNDSLLCCIAQSQYTSPETLASLARSRYKDVLTAVARNPRTPEDVLARLAKAKNIDVRASVAYNRALTTALAGQLAKDAAWNVRYQLAANPSVDPSILNQGELANMMAVLVAKTRTNWMFTNKVLCELAQHPDEQVRAAAQQRIDDGDSWFDGQPGWETPALACDALREQLGELTLIEVIGQQHLEAVLEPVDKDVAEIAVVLCETWEQSLVALLSAASAA